MGVPHNVINHVILLQLSTICKHPKLETKAKIDRQLYQQDGAVPTDKECDFFVDKHNV